MLEVFSDHWDEELNFLHHTPHWCRQHGCLDLFTADTHEPPQPHNPAGSSTATAALQEKGGTGFSG